MSSIDDRGRRAGADLLRSASRSSGPPLTELVARRRARTRGIATAGLAMALVAAGVWAVARPDGGSDAIEVRSTASYATDTTSADGRPDTETVAADGGADDGSDGAATGEARDGADPSPSAPDPTGPASGGRGPGTDQGTPRSTTAPALPAERSPSPTPSSAPVTTPGPSPADPSPPPTTSPATADPPTPNPDPTPDPDVEPTPDPAPTPDPDPGPEPDGPPWGTLTPVSPAWDPTCATADQLLAAAWAVDAGTSNDIVGVALLFIEVIGKIPPGVAVAEVAYTADLLDAMQGGHGVAPFAGSFTANAATLLGALGAGCGTPGALPLPASTVPQIYTIVFELGLF